MQIRPPGFWPGIGLRELWDSRDLLYFFTKREIQIRYAQSVFGVSLAVLQPLAFAFVFALFFGVVVKIETEIPYPVFAVIGLVPWLFFAGALSQAAMSLVLDQGMLSKVYFPRLVLPLARALSLMLDLAIALVVMLIVMWVYGVGIASTAPLVLPFLLMGVLTAFGLGTLFAALNVKYRDIQVVVPMITQVGLFATPVAYPSSLVPPQLEPLYTINPMASVLEGVRWALAGTAPPTARTVAAGAAMTLLFLAVSIFYFRRSDRDLADVI